MFFFGVSIKENRIRKMFDLARFVLQPDFYRPSHITLRGPYQTKPSNKKWIGSEIGNIIINRPNHFFGEGQSTVYLSCTNIFFQDFWHKPDYPEGVPHLTIYDGSDRKLAWQVIDVLRRFEWNLEVEVTKIGILDKKKDFEHSFITYLDDEVDRLFNNVSGHSFDHKRIRQWHIGQRVEVLRLLCGELNRNVVR